MANELVGCQWPLQLITYKVFTSFFLKSEVFLLAPQADVDTAIRVLMKAGAYNHALRRSFEAGNDISGSATRETRQPKGWCFECIEKCWKAKGFAAKLGWLWSLMLRKCLSKQKGLLRKLSLLLQKHSCMVSCRRCKQVGSRCYAARADKLYRTLCGWPRETYCQSGKIFGDTFGISWPYYENGTPVPYFED